jgi:hypothetical protein
MCPRVFNNMNIFLLISVGIFLLNSCKDEEALPSITPLDSFSLRIISPLVNESTTPGDSIHFQGQIYGDTLISTSKLKAIWKSDKDGILNEGTFDKKGFSEFYSNKLSKNIHRIIFEVRNELDSLIIDEVKIYNLIKLYPLEKTDNSIYLRWCSWKSSTFKRFSVFRSLNSENISSGELIYSTNQISDTTFTDTLAQLGNYYHYQVFVDYEDNINVGSKIKSISAGKFIKVNYPILKILVDPKRDIAYGIVRPKSIYDVNKTGYGLVFINTKSLQIEKRILENIKFSDLDINLEGTYLFLVSRSNIVYKIDLAKQDLETVFYLNDSAHKLEIGSNDKLFYHVTPPTSGSTGFGIYDLKTNTNIPDKRPYNNPLTVSHGDMEINSLTNEIIHGESNTTGASVSRISTVKDSLHVIGEWGNLSSFNDLIFYNETKQYIVWQNLLFDDKLNLIGRFLNENVEEYIYAISPDGEVVTGWNNLYKTLDQRKIKRIPANYSIASFINNRQLILGYTNSSVYQEFESYIYIYSF